MKSALERIEKLLQELNYVELGEVGAMAYSMRRRNKVEMQEPSWKKTSATLEAYKRGDKDFSAQYLTGAVSRTLAYAAVQAMLVRSAQEYKEACQYLGGFGEIGKRLVQCLPGSWRELTEYRNGMHVDITKLPTNETIDRNDPPAVSGPAHVVTLTKYLELLDHGFAVEKCTKRPSEHVRRMIQATLTYSKRCTCKAKPISSWYDYYYDYCD